MADTQEDYAVIIGINQYESFTSLKGAAADAIAFERWARDKAGVPKDHIQVLANPDAPSSMAAIKDAFVEIGQKSNDGQKRVGRRLYIFLAGHGAGTDIDRSGIVASDHRLFTPNLFAATGVANAFVRLALFDEVLLFMDCCRSWEGHLEGQNPFNASMMDQSTRSVKHCYAYAAELDQKAREREFDDGYRGLFSKALLQGLEGRAVDPAKQGVTVGSLAKFVRTKMEELGAKRQNAEFKLDDDILLVESEVAPMTQVTVRLSDPDRGFVVFHGTDLVNPIEIEPTEIDGNTRQISLPSHAKYLFAVLDDQGDWEIARKKTVMDEPMEIEL